MKRPELKRKSPMARSAIKPDAARTCKNRACRNKFTPTDRHPFAIACCTGCEIILEKRRIEKMQSTQGNRKAPLKSKQRPVSTEEKALWDRMASIGCIACLIDGNENPFVSIHHVRGRTSTDCHQWVLPLCAGHHQDGTGEDKTMIAVHPYKAQFEARYGTQYELLGRVMERIGR